MPIAEREDGVQIAWREQGEGPPVVLANIGYAPPDVLQPLVEELAGDHRLLAYYPRGTGASSRVGPYDIDLDADDLLAVLEQAGARSAVAVATGDGGNRAIVAASRRPDLIAAVVVSGNLALAGGDSLSNSRSVLEGLLTLLSTDYRAGLHAMLGTGNPELDDTGKLERIEQTVANCDQEAAAARIRAWISHDLLPGALELGGRLWILHYETNPWFAGSEGSRALLPQAIHREIADGPFSRPELTAAVIREVTQRPER